MRLIDANKLMLHLNDYALTVAGKNFIEYETVLSIMDYIEGLMTKDWWILCSDKLPPDGEEVLVTRLFTGSDDVSLKPNWYVEVATYCSDFDEWESDSDYLKFGKHLDPIAWMPLPQPYRGDEE